MGIIKSRKNYICDHCGCLIPKDILYEFGKGRGPRYDCDGTQIGIEYYQYRLCVDSEGCNRRYESEEYETKPWFVDKVTKSGAI